MGKDHWKLVAVTAAVTITLTKIAEVAWKKYVEQKDAITQQVSVKKTLKREYDDNLFREQLARNYAFLGEDGMEKLKNQYIVVVGAGGVGSWVVTMLIRSGCKKIRVIDFDQVSLSSLNRHS